MIIPMTSSNNQRLSDFGVELRETRNTSLLTGNDQQRGENPGKAAHRVFTGSIVYDICV